ncbi:MAG TPA: hypothetical protein VIK68_11175 [Sphingomicrobium sp.]
MRNSLVVLPLSLCAAPAMAQPAPNPIPRALTDPATVHRLTDSMQSLSQALLDMRVGNIQAALEGRAPTPAERDLTVGDLARRNDPQFDQHLQQNIEAARPKIEQSVRALSEAVPEVTEDLQRARKSLERAMSNLPDPNYPRR